MDLFRACGQLRTAAALCLCACLLLGTMLPSGGQRAYAGNNWVIQVKPEYQLFPLGEPATVTVGVIPPDLSVADYSVLLEVLSPYHLILVSACEQYNVSKSICAISIPPPKAKDNQPKQDLTYRVIVRDKSGFGVLARSASQTITYSEQPDTPGMTWDDVSSYRTKATRWKLGEMGSVAAGVVAGCISTAYSLGVAGYIWAVTGGTMWVAATESAEDTALSNDPIDHNFTQIATPATSPPLLFPPATGVNGAMVNAFNALAATSSQFTGLTAALLTSLNRAHGALQAGNTAWKNRQLAIAAGFATRAARLVSAEPALLARLQQAIAAAGIRIPVTAALSQQIQQDVAAHGLPSFLTQPLLAAGLDQHRVDQLAHDVGAAPAHPGSSTFPDLLIDPQLLAAIEGEAAALRRFAARVPKGVAATAAGVDTHSARRTVLHPPTVTAGLQQVGFTAGDRAQARPSFLPVQRGAVEHFLYPRVLTARQIATSETHTAMSWRQFAAGSCRKPPPVTTTTIATPSSSAGDLQQDGKIMVGPVSPCTGCTWNTGGAGSLSGTVTTDSPLGHVTYTWKLPARIPRSGATGTITLTVNPGRAGKFSNLEAELSAAGEVDAICGAGNPNCIHIEAYSKGGNTASATSTFTLKARDYSAGRTQPVYVTIGCAWGGPAITIPYRVVQ